LLDALTPVFERGAFKALKIDRIIPLSEEGPSVSRSPEAKRGAGWSWRREVASATTVLALLGPFRVARGSSGTSESAADPLSFPAVR
jgi:hypothetical protein